MDIILKQYYVILYKKYSELSCVIKISKPAVLHGKNKLYMK